MTRMKLNKIVIKMVLTEIVFTAKILQMNNNIWVYYSSNNNIQALENHIINHSLIKILL